MQNFITLEHQLLGEKLSNEREGGEETPFTVDT